MKITNIWGKWSYRNGTGDKNNITVQKKYIELDRENNTGRKWITQLYIPISSVNGNEDSKTPKRTIKRNANN